MRAGRIAFLGALFLALAVPPAAPQGPSDPPWEIVDGADDQSVRGNAVFFSVGPEVPLPVAPSPHSDLRRVTIEGETPVGLFVNFFVGPFQVEPDESSIFTYDCESSGGSSSSGRNGPESIERTEYELKFDLPDAPVRYAVRVNVVGTRAGPGSNGVFTMADAQGYVCLDIKEGGSYLQSADATLDPGASAIRVWVPKASLLGVGREPEGFFSFFGRDEDDRPRPSALRKGDRFTDFTARTISFLPEVDRFGPSIVDDAPEGKEAPEYVLTAPAANQQIALSLGDEEGVQAVAAGLNQTIPFVLENRAAAKRIVQLSYALEGADAASYAVSGPASATLSGGSSINLTLALLVPAGATSDDGVSVVVQGRSAGVLDEVAHASALVLPTPVIGPGANVLYLHGRTFEDLFSPTCAVRPAFCSDAFLSVLPDDPKASDPDRAWMFLFPSDEVTSMSAFFPIARLDQAVSVAVAFDPGQPVQIDLKMRSPVEIAGIELLAAVTYRVPGEGATMMLAESTATATVTPAGSLITIAAPLRLDGDGPILPTGTRFGLYLDARVPTSPGSGAAFATDGLEVWGGESKITLPLVDLPADQRPEAKASPFQLIPLSGREDFVNPGEARLFNISLLSQANEARNARLTVEVQPTTWTAEILPGADFRVQPGDTLRLSVLVHAPATAQENEAATIWVNATSDDAAPATLRLTANAVSIDTPDDSASYKADDDATGRLLAKEGKETPSPSAALALVGIAAAAALAYRRRR